MHLWLPSERAATPLHFPCPATIDTFRTTCPPTGCPRHTGQTCVLGSAPNSLAQPQKALVRVPSCTCVSMPITASYSTCLRMGEAACEGGYKSQRMCNGKGRQELGRTPAQRACLGKERHCADAYGMLQAALPCAAHTVHNGLAAPSTAATPHRKRARTLAFAAAASVARLAAGEADCAAVSRAAVLPAPRPPAAPTARLHTPKSRSCCCTAPQRRWAPAGAPGGAALLPARSSMRAAMPLEEYSRSAQLRRRARMASTLSTFRPPGWRHQIITPCAL